MALQHRFHKAEEYHYRIPLAHKEEKLLPEADALHGELRKRVHDYGLQERFLTGSEQFRFYRQRL